MLNRSFTGIQGRSFGLNIGAARGGGIFFWIFFAIFGWFRHLNFDGNFTKKNLKMKKKSDTEVPNFLKKIISFISLFDVLKQTYFQVLFNLWTIFKKRSFCRQNWEKKVKLWKKNSFNFFLFCPNYWCGNCRLAAPGATPMYMIATTYSTYSFSDWPTRSSKEIGIWKDGSRFQGQNCHHQHWVSKMGSYDAGGRDEPWGSLDVSSRPSLG